MMAPDYRARVEAASQYLRSQISEFPSTAIVLGTGLDELISSVSVISEIPYVDIPHFPVSAVQSHQGSLVYGTIESQPIILLRGRVHLYEGYDANTVTLPVRALGLCGIKTLVLTNVCGAMNPGYRSGDIVLIKDHINMMGHNPLEGPNVDDWGPRFPDMSDPYNSSLRDLVRRAANAASIPIQEGVYVSVVGPNLETRSEYIMLRLLGADVVGMSTVPEVLAARHMGISVIAFSVVTDESSLEDLQPFSLDDVLAAAKKASPKMISLIKGVIRLI
jgi:purine-nucleoside phosphorylase